jgi:hypothetical protein
MAQAADYSIRFRLSSLIADPFVRAAFQRAERDNPPLPVMPTASPRPVLTGGAAEPISNNAARRCAALAEG